jgi:nucleoside-diphosphate-sugar epimerase
VTTSYLVTGGTGFIGSAVVRALVRSGARVRTLDNDSRGHRGKLGEVADDVEVFVGDVRDADAVARAVRGVDCVCHLAYINGTEYFYTKPALVLEVAVKGMINVLDACLRHGVGDLVLASSSEVYQTPARVPTDETAQLVVPDVLNPRYSYGGGKIISELLALNYGRQHFQRVVIFRPHNVYGPDMGQEHVIPQFALRLRELCRATEGPVRLPIQGTGDETRAFVFIDDMIDGVLRVIHKGEHLGVYHVGNDEEISIRRLATEVGHVFGREVVVVPGPLREGGALRRCPDISKLRDLGFRPKVALRDGLAVTVRWYEANADQQMIKNQRGADNERTAA